MLPVCAWAFDGCGAMARITMNRLNKREMEDNGRGCFENICINFLFLTAEENPLKCEHFAGTHSRHHRGGRAVHEEWPPGLQIVAGCGDYIIARLKQFLRDGRVTED
jgi:hypothetical protein